MRMEAFVYCWTDHTEEKLYVGSHRGTPDDGYVCSSKYMLEEYMKRRQDFTREIIASGSEEDMRSFEELLLKSVNAKQDESFYNRCNADGKFYPNPGPQTLEHRTKISSRLVGNKNNLGRVQSEETKEKIRAALRGRKLSVEHRENLKGKRTGGWKHSEETKRKISETKSKQ